MLGLSLGLGLGENDFVVGVDTVEDGESTTDGGDAIFFDFD